MFNRPIKSAVDRFDENRNLMQIYYKFESHNCYILPGMMWFLAIEEEVAEEV